MTPEIRNLTRDIAGQMAALHERAFHKGWSKSDFIENIDNEYDDVLGIVAGNDLRGFVLVRTQGDQAEILTIVVDPAQQGAGHGRALLKAGEERAMTRGATIMFLEAAQDNPAALALYKKAGYKRCGTRKAYYRREKGRVDALLFQKKLI